jgi:ketosteroid isomerase-like protein
MRLSPTAIVLLFAWVACGAVMRPDLAWASPETFVALEDGLSQVLAAYDARDVDALWDDDLVFVSPNGRVTRKAERLAGLAPPAIAASVALTSHNDSVEVQYEDAGVAVVIVHSTWRLGTSARGDRYVATHVWIKRGDRWRLLSAQVAQVAR